MQKDEASAILGGREGLRKHALQLFTIAYVYQPSHAVLFK